MRILVQALTAAPGGSIRGLLALLSGWPSEDEILCLTWRSDMAAQMREGGRDVLVVQARNTVHALCSAMSKHHKTIIHWQPDVVYSQQYYLPGVPAPQVLQHRNMLRFQTHRCSLSRELLRDGLAVGSLRRSACNVFNSRSLLVSAQERWPYLLNSRTAVIHNAVDTAQLVGLRRTEPKEIRILVPQGDAPHKRNALALAVFDRLRRQIGGYGSRPLRLIIAGVGDYDEARADVRRLGMDEDVRFVGYVTHEDLGKLYASCRAVLITSGAESFCNPVVEAHAAGVPIVTPPLPVMEEVGGPLSYIAAEDTPEAIALALFGAVNWHRNSATLSAARAHANRFSPRIKAAEMRNLFSSINPALS